MLQRRGSQFEVAGCLVNRPTEEGHTLQDHSPEAGLQEEEMGVLESSFSL